MDGRRVRTPYSDKRAAEVWRRTYLAETASGRRRVGAENATMADLLDLVEARLPENRKGQHGGYGEPGEALA